MADFESFDTNVHADENLPPKEVFTTPNNEREAESDALQAMVNVDIYTPFLRRGLFCDSGINVATRFYRLPRNPDGGAIFYGDDMAEVDHITEMMNVVDLENNSYEGMLNLAGDYQQAFASDTADYSDSNSDLSSVEQQSTTSSSEASSLSFTDKEIQESLLPYILPTAGNRAYFGNGETASTLQTKLANIGSANRSIPFQTHHHLSCQTFLDARLCEAEYAYMNDRESRDPHCISLTPTDYCFICQETTIHGDFSRCYCLDCFEKDPIDPYSAYFEKNPDAKADYYFIASIGPPNDKQPTLIEVDPATAGIAWSCKKPFSISRADGWSRPCRIMMPQTENGGQTIVRNDLHGFRAFTVHKTCFKTVYTLAKRIGRPMQSVVGSMYEYAYSVLPVNSVELVRERRPILDLDNFMTPMGASSRSPANTLFAKIMKLPNELQQGIIQQIDGDSEAARIFYAYRLAPCILARTECPKLYRDDISWDELLHKNYLVRPGTSSEYICARPFYMSAELWTMGHAAYMTNLRVVSTPDNRARGDDERRDKYLNVFNVAVSAVENINYYEVFTGPYGITQILVFFKDATPPGILGRSNEGDLRSRIFCPFPRLVYFGVRIVDVTEAVPEGTDDSLVRQSMWSSEMPPANSVVCSSGFEHVTGHHFSYLPFEKDGIYCTGITALMNRNGITSVTIHHRDGKDHTVAKKQRFETQLPCLPLTFMLQPDEVITGLWRAGTGQGSFAGSFFAVFTNQSRSFIFGPIMASIRQFTCWSTLTNQHTTKVKGMAVDTAPNSNNMHHLAAVFDEDKAVFNSMDVHIPSDRTQLVRHAFRGRGSWELYNSFAALDNAVRIELACRFEEPVGMKITYNDDSCSILGDWVTEGLRVETTYDIETDGNLQGLQVYNSTTESPGRRFHNILGVKAYGSRTEVPNLSGSNTVVVENTPGMILRWTYSYYASFLEVWDGLCAYHDGLNGHYVSGYKMHLQC
ncbi:hypothetical protein BROUX41_005882 [Berkeleyomyces rouxiae]|uniref:uncharacterized protein n=1 Tax=Berkeleyomyces rouxiae TaxID=2035830 RepID=UPI003B7FCEBB